MASAPGTAPEVIKRAARLPGRGCCCCAWLSVRHCHRTAGRADYDHTVVALRTVLDATWRMRQPGRVEGMALEQAISMALDDGT